MAAQVRHEHWSSRFAFLMAAIGSAVGLGNIWRFPFITGENGGGAFILIYLVTTALIALPILIAEVMLGRMGQQSPINAMRAVAQKAGRSKFWVVIGIGSTLGAFVVLSYYSVIGGWAIRYFFYAVSGTFTGMDNDASLALFQTFTADAGQVVLWHTLFIGINVGIVIWGLHAGIEKAVTVLMPLLFILLVGMAIYSSTTPGFEKAVTFLFHFDFGKVKPLTFLTAIGQGFFSVSVALGAMMTYGAYLDKSENIARSGIIIAIADTMVAILAGLVIFPLVFSYGLEAGSGPGLIFVTLPITLGKLGTGIELGAAFFLLLMVAAVTSAISLLEPVVSWAEESLGVKRKVSAAAMGAAAWFVGLGSAFSFNIWSDFHPLSGIDIFADKTIFDALDLTSTSLVMPTVGLLIALFAGWALSAEATAEALNADPDAAWFRWWRFLMRYVAPLGVVSIFVANGLA